MARHGKAWHGTGNHDMAGHEANLMDAHGQDVADHCAESPNLLRSLAAPIYTSMLFSSAAEN